MRVATLLQMVCEVLIDKIPCFIENFLFFDESVFK